jgi:hypothetical protein
MTDRRPLSAALLPLSQVVASAPDDQEPVPGFVGQVAGAEYVVTAVLQRTAVLEVAGDRWADRRTAPLDDVLVNPGTIAWRAKPPSASYRTWRGAACGCSDGTAGGERRAGASRPGAQAGGRGGCGGSAPSGGRGWPATVVGARRRGGTTASRVWRRNRGPDGA